MFDLRYLRHNESIATFYLKNIGLIFRSVREACEIEAIEGDEGKVEYSYSYQTDLVDSRAWESITKKEYYNHQRYQEIYTKGDSSKHFRNEEYYKECPQSQALSTASKALWLTCLNNKTSMGVSQSASKCSRKMTSPSLKRERPVAELVTYLEYSVFRLEWVLMNHAGLNYDKNMDFFSQLPESFVEFLIADEHKDMRFSPGKWLSDAENLKGRVGLIDIVFRDIPAEIKKDLECVLKEYRIEYESYALN